jgi:hypothetical protein
MFIISLSLTCFAQKKTTPKKENDSGSQFEMTIEHNGEKKEIKYTQFQSADGNATAEGSQNKRVMFFYGASNNNDNKNFSFNAMIPTAEKGVYKIGDEGVSFNLTASEFSNVPMFLPKNGQIEITAMPLKGGFVEGTFSVECQNVKDDGTIETYNVSGSFKLKRM